MPPGADPRSAGVREDVGPRRASPEVLAEIAALLETDDTRLGQVYRGLQRRLSPDAIAAELDVASSSFVWNYERVIRALVGDIPPSPAVALAAARLVKALLK
jgi:hypothetical protein